MPALQAFVVGSIECEVVSDGYAANDREIVFANVAPEELGPALEGQLDERGKVVTPYNPFLIRADGKTVLIDTGIGEYAELFQAPAGRLLESLRGRGVNPRDIDFVILTHGHPDHVGGLTTERAGLRQPVFENARHVIWRAEYDFWISEASDALPEMLTSPPRIQLPPLREAGVLEMIDDETEVVPGVRLVFAPGHTPGHMALEIAEGNDSFLYLADAVVHELNFEHPDWLSAVDTIPQVTVETRRRLLDRAVERGSIVTAFHLDRVGHVEASHGSYRLV